MVRSGPQRVGRVGQSLHTRYIIRGNQGVASLLLGQLADAALALDEALEVCHEAGAEGIIDETLLATAALAAEVAEVPRAARLAGAAERHRVGLQAPDEEEVWDRLQAGLEKARARADPEAWERAEGEGAQLDATAAIALARSGLTAAKQAASAAEPADA